MLKRHCLYPFVYEFLKVLYIVTLYTEYTRALTSENLCQDHDAMSADRSNMLLYIVEVTTLHSRNILLYIVVIYYCI
jgi:hypothetical protein